MRGARTDMMTRDEKLARDLAGGQQERSHQQMGNMLELFDRYDAESKWRKKAIPGAPLPPWQNKSSVANSTASAAIREELWSNRKKIPSTAAAVVQQESHGDVLSPMLHNPNQLRHKQYHEYKTQTQKATQHHNFFCHEGRCHGLQHQHPQQHQKASYGAYTDSTSSSQNVGNTIGTRPKYFECTSRETRRRRYSGRVTCNGTEKRNRRATPKILLFCLSLAGGSFTRPTITPD